MLEARSKQCLDICLRQKVHLNFLPSFLQSHLTRVNFNDSITRCISSSLQQAIRW